MQESVSKNLGHQNFYKMNHKWEDDICTKCGCKREKRLRLVNITSRLNRHGVWVDALIYADYPEWAFSFTGTQWQFKRPKCVRKNDDRVPTHTEQSEV